MTGDSKEGATGQKAGPWWETSQLHYCNALRSPLLQSTVFQRSITEQYRPAEQPCYINPT